MQTTDPLMMFSFFLPKGTLQYFDLVHGERTQESIFLTLEEKNDPPLEERHEGTSVLSKGFQDITVTDFPARGKAVTLTFRRRRWQVGDELLKREIPIAAEGTQLQKEFADFLKERS
jgi:hypothetical protein